MKRCPQCNRTETDDALIFCRLDGARLSSVDNESATAILSSEEVRPRTKTGSRPRRSTKCIDSIAVLPFENAGNDVNTEYLSDGMTEIIINNLSQVPKLKVMARSTVFRYKGQQIDPEQVGRELGVRAVATGRVQQLADRLTIGVELVDAADGSLLWGERYSRKMDDIVALQDEIGHQITHNLRLRLSRSQKKRLTKLQTSNSKAYELYLKGRFFWNKRTQEDASRGIDYFQQALSLDPNFALAYAGVADCQTLLGDVGIQAMPPKEAFLQGQQSAARALQLDDALGEAHATMGHISMHLFAWSQAEKEFRRALELNPSNAQASLWYAYYLAFTGRFNDSIATINIALQLDPLSSPVTRSAAELLYFAGRFDESIDRFDEAIEMDSHYLGHLELGRVYEHRKLYQRAFEEFRKAKELSHDSTESLASLAHCHAVSGQTADAELLLRDLTRLSEQQYISPYDLALIHKGLGQREECYKWLNRACEIHDGWMIYITVDPRWQSVSKDASFAEIVRRVGLTTHS
ncbi:MAG TPA: tetratricopeptide repeat protein [Pyrinomonadaceae bacterium]|nr:tetratricopeptide repeat protein [Pyrinomonadaceae bacterium]